MWHGKRERRDIKAESKQTSRPLRCQTNNTLAAVLSGFLVCVLFLLYNVVLGFISFNCSAQEGSLLPGGLLGHQQVSE